MLIQFEVENFRSIGEAVQLDMTPAGIEHGAKHVIEDQQGKKVKALRLAGIYGPNASGKSNLIKAMKTCQDLICDGLRSEQKLPYTPNRLNGDGADKPTFYRWLFKVDGVVYDYGIEHNQDHITEEWLHGYFTNRASMMFERLRDDKTGQYEFNIGKKLTTKGKSESFFKDYVAEGTRPNQPFLYELTDKNVPTIQPIVDWFKTQLVVIFPGAKYHALVDRIAEDQNFTGQLVKLLKTADLSIDNLHVEQTPAPEEIKNFIQSIVEDEKEDVSPSRFRIQSDYFKRTEDGQLMMQKLLSQHKDINNNAIDFEMRDESDGTISFMHLCPALLMSQDKPKVIVFDEFNRSLHPHLAVHFIRTFLANVQPDCQTQMIFTTHESKILSAGILERDEIWLTEKDAKYQTQLIPLVEFKERNDKRIEPAYLAGRFGGVPHLIDPELAGLLTRCKE